jgi:hypothetical protein
MALDAIREKKPFNPLASQFGVHPAFVASWRRVMGNRAHASSSIFVPFFESLTLTVLQYAIQFRKGVS